MIYMLNYLWIELLDAFNLIACFWEKTIHKLNKDEINIIIFMLWTKMVLINYLKMSFWIYNLNTNTISKTNVKHYKNKFKNKWHIFFFFGNMKNVCLLIVMMSTLIDPLQINPFVNGLAIMTSINWKQIQFCENRISFWNNQERPWDSLHSTTTQALMQTTGLHQRMSIEITIKYKNKNKKGDKQEEILQKNSRILETK